MAKTAKGFTLAEVLITLVVIGIIAAITVPLLMANHKRTETVTRLKKAYTTITNAIKLSEVENGLSFKDWDYSLDAENFYYTYLNKYITNSKIESAGWKDPLSGGEELMTVWLNDGIMIAIDGIAYDNFKSVWVDVNGDKKPNSYGRDIFYFELAFDNNGQLYSSSNLSRKQVINYCKDTKYSTSAYFCAHLIISDGWEIKDDYPVRL